MFAIERQIALEAIKQCRKVATNTLSTTYKLDASPVTAVDYAIQAITNLKIISRFPTDLICGEESSHDLKTNVQLADLVANLVNKTLGSNLENINVCDAIDMNQSGGGSTRFWTLDPIDGTKGFIRGGQYAICLALIDQGKVQVGVLGCPQLKFNAENVSETEHDDLGTIFVAVRGHGAYKTRFTESSEEYVINVSKTVDPSQITLLESYESAHSSQVAHLNNHKETSAKIAGLLGVHTQPARLDSQVKYGILADAKADLYLRIPTNPKYQENIWDHAAGSLIVEEAGGVVTDMNGNGLDFGNGKTLGVNFGIVVSNGSIHDSAISAIKQIGWTRAHI